MIDFEIIEEDKNKLKILFKGELTTLPELLRKRLYSYEDVVIAAYKVLHPLENKIEFYLETKSKNPREILVNTLKEIVKELDHFQKEYEEAIKRWK